MPDLPLRSQRAQILRKVLDYINYDDFEDEGFYPFMIFGKGAFEEWLHNPSPYAGQDDIVHQARELASDLRRRQGVLRASDRTSVAGPPPAKAPRGTDLLKAIEQVTGKPVEQTMQRFAETENQRAEAFDQFYANLLLEKLDDIVKRVSLFEPIEVQAQNPEVQEYFKEAHNLYLFGFRIGAAVLCRPLIDSALEDKFGVRDRKKGDKYGPGETASLWQAAAEGGPLDKDDVKHAAWVREAGNCAIHDLDEFQRDYGDERLPDLISVTRTIFSKISAWGSPSTLSPR